MGAMFLVEDATAGARFRFQKLSGHDVAQWLTPIRSMTSKLTVTRSWRSSP